MARLHVLYDEFPAEFKCVERGFSKCTKEWSILVLLPVFQPTM
jgi:hypothetical protein